MGKIRQKCVKIVPNISVSYHFGPESIWSCTFELQTLLEISEDSAHRCGTGHHFTSERLNSNTAQKRNRFTWLMMGARWNCPVQCPSLPQWGAIFLANDIANDAPLAHLAQKHSSRAHLESWSRKPPLMALKTEVDRTALLKFSFSQPSTPQPGSVRLFFTKAHGCCCWKRDVVRSAGTQH